MNLSDLNPSDPNFAQQVEARLIQYEDEYSIEKYPSRFNSRIGASSIADDCWRKLWYKFRWVKLEQAEARTRRLWNRGHREEEIFESFLLWAGIKLRSINPKTGQQYSFSKINDHYSGRTDGVGLIGWANDYPIIVEFKTFADKYFNELKKKKLKISNPKYFGQMCSYGREFEVKHALFGAVNKDNDEWYWEFVALDFNYATELENKARDIIYAIIPPDKINQNPAFYKCKMCHFSGICHEGEPIEKNCRSCINSIPAQNAQWHCNEWGKDIPNKDAIMKGCPQWQRIV